MPNKSLQQTAAHKSVLDMRFSAGRRRLNLGVRRTRSLCGRIRSCPGNMVGKGRRTEDRREARWFRAHVEEQALLTPLRGWGPCGSFAPQAFQVIQGRAERLLGRDCHVRLEA